MECPKSIIFYNSKKSYVGYKKFKSIPENWLEISNWIDEGNYIKTKENNNSGLCKNKEYTYKYYSIPFFYGKE